MYIVAIIDSMERLKFFRRLEAGLKQQKVETVYVTNRLSIFLREKYNCTIYLIREIGTQHKEKIDRPTLTKEAKRCREFLGFNIPQAQCEKLIETSYSYMHSLFTSKEISAIFCWNGHGGIEIGATIAAKNQNIPTIFFELANIPGYVFADTKGVNAHSNLFKNPEILLELPKHDVNLWQNWKNAYVASKRIQSTVPQAKTSGNVNPYYALDILGFIFLSCPQDRSLNLIKRLQERSTLSKLIPRKHPQFQIESISHLPPKYIFFAAQVSNDTQMLLNSETHTIEALELFSDRANQLGLPGIVKPHPAESNTKALRKLIYKCRDLGLKVSTHNTFELLDGSLELWTINSTVGLEAKIMGVPTIFLGRSFYKRFSEDHTKSYILNYLLSLDYYSDKIADQKVCDRLIGLIS